MLTCALAGNMDPAVGSGEMRDNSGALIMAQDNKFLVFSIDLESAMSKAI
jgi:hypothetical protein